MSQPVPDQLVDIVLPSGERATVPQGDLGQALAAGAKPLETPVEGPDGGGLAGAVATGVLGAGRTATGGLSDKLIRAGADVIGGEGLRKETMATLSQAREANSKANFIGEGAGLFLPGFGTGLSAAGEGVESAVADRLGEGLLSKAASMGARGALEGAMLGAGQQTSEDALGDHEYNGQAVFASAARDGLLGGAAGALLGVGSHYVGEGLGLLARKHGPAPDAVLDEVAGAPGAGRALRSDAREAEDFVTKARIAGATSDQAAQMVDDANTLAKARANAGIGSGLVDGLADAYAKTGNASMAELKSQQYATAAKKIAEHEEVLDKAADTMSKRGTEALRKLEDTVNEVQFRSKSEQMSKLVDVSKIGSQTDTAASMLQDVDAAMNFWGNTMAKGGAEGALKSVRKYAEDAATAMGRAVENGGEGASRELFMKMDQLKQTLDSFSRWGTDHGLPEAVDHPQFGIRAMADKFRGALEDESLWGKAAAAQRDWNSSFSEAIARRNHFGREMGVAIDSERGRVIPEVDFEKTRGMLSRLRGSEVDDSIQAVRSTTDFVAGLRNRVRAIEEHGDLTAAQRVKLTKGRSALDAFEKSFADARQQSTVVNRLKAQQQNEQGKGMGGLLGIIGDVVSKPLTTMDRLAQVRLTTEKVENAVAGGLRKFFGQGGEELAGRLAPRAKDAIAKDIATTRELAANPAALESKTESMVAELRKVAPKIADSVKATAQRAIYFLAKEAPQASVPLGIIGYHNAAPRYSDQQAHAWEAKRIAALDPKTVVDDMQRGRLNRDAVRTAEVVAPQLFAKMQELAQDQIAKLESEGKLDAMPYQQKAAIATLLKVPADGTWKPDFIAMMQAAKMQPALNSPGAGASTVPQPNQGVSKRRVEINTDIFGTAAQDIEAGGIAS